MNRLKTWWWNGVESARLNSFFALSVLVVLFLLQVPQIWNVMTQTIQVGTSAAKGRELAFRFLAFLFFTGTFSLGSMLGVNRPLAKIGGVVKPVELSTRVRWWLRGISLSLSLVLLVVTSVVTPPIQLWMLTLAVLVSCPVAVCIIGGLSGWLVWLGSFAATRTTRIIVAAILGIGSVAALAYAEHEQLGLTGSLIWQLTANVGLTGLWLALCSIPREGREASELIKTPGKVLGWFTVSLVIAEIVWWAAVVRSQEGWSFRLYTIWGVMNIAALIVVLGAMLDHWIAETGWPMHFIGLCALIVMFVGFWSRPQPMNLVQPPAITKQATYAKSPQQSGTDVAQDWYDHVLARLRFIDDGRPDGDPKAPVVFVAASGGGSRAAVFTALTLEALEREPLDTRGRSWAEHILMISSVSGGSLATGYYAHRITHPTSLPTGSGETATSDEAAGTATPADLSERPSRLSLRDEPRHAIRSEVVFRMGEIIRQAVEEELDKSVADDDISNMLAQLEKNLEDWMHSADESASHPCDGFEKARTVPEWRVIRGMLKTWQDCAALRGDLPPSGPSTWILQSAFVDDMWVDFMAPIIRGALTPTVNRGQTLRYFWNSQFGWGESNSADGYAYTESTRATGSKGIPAIKPAYHPKDHPIVLFNSCDVRLGTRVVVGFPTLPADLLTAAHVAPGGDGEKIRRPRVLDEAVPPKVVPLADAVGMSANFPFGFNLLRVEGVTGPMPRPMNGSTHWTHLIDGGFVDNTGIDTIYEIFRGLKAMAQSNEPGADTSSVPESSQGAPQTAPQKAAEIMDRLRNRMIIVFEIDSGAKPEEPGLFTNMASLILEPINGYTNVSYTNAELAKRTYLKELERMAGTRDAPPREDDPSRSIADDPDSKPPSALRHLPFVCNHLGSDNVMTAWALGPEDKAEVLIRFLIEYHSHDRDLHRPTAELEEIRKVRRQKRTLATLQHLDEQLKSLPAQAAEPQIDSVKETAHKALSMKAQIDRFGKRVGDPTTAEKVQNRLEQLSQPDTKLSGEEMEDIKQVLSKDLPLDAWQRAAAADRSKVGTYAGKAIDTKQFFEKRPPIRKK